MALITKRDKISTAKRKDIYDSFISKHTRKYSADEIGGGKLTEEYERKAYSLDYHFESEIKFLADYIKSYIEDDLDAQFLLEAMLSSEMLSDSDLSRVKIYGNRYFALSNYFKTKINANLYIAAEGIQYLIQARDHVEHSDAHGAALALIKASAKSRLVFLAMFEKAIHRGHEKTERLREKNNKFNDEQKERVVKLVKEKMAEGKSAKWAYDHIHAKWSTDYPSEKTPSVPSIKRWHRESKK
ncbi:MULTISPECIES: hypothetical protein [Shewanella]|uniref:hypothetical protein n=1 Tax=Shewanella TaxID=22 RepID=UPI001AAE1F24|nr:hypothetical protein [Shewanella algae]EKT4489925.1 hypothetical protein [Shewanella algae]MBO2548919.1 hypothetical protein [Shewanella algae]